MKKSIYTVGILAIVVLGFTSCKDEKQAQAEKTVNNYVVYVDSLDNVSEADAKSNWEVINASYQLRISEAEASLAESDNEALREKVAVSKAKYEALKAKYQAEIEADKPVVANPNQLLRNRFFGEGKVGEDMNFSWVNKDNILQVYQDFLDSYEKNKGDFTREDYDEVKLIYEALDSRKNTVEKEGLSSSDNKKIASIKFRFSPMFKMNRIGAKSREMEKAKE